MTASATRRGWYNDRDNSRIVARYNDTDFLRGTATTLTVPEGITFLSGQLGVSDGGTVTQITTAATGVTLNTSSGQITTVTQNIAAAAEVQFTVTNSVVAATSVVVVNVASGSTGGTTIASVTAVAAGSFQITLTNLHASVAETGVLVINFAVIAGSAT